MQDIARTFQVTPNACYFRGEKASLERHAQYIKKTYHHLRQSAPFLEKSIFRLAVPSMQPPSLLRLLKNKKKIKPNQTKKKKKWDVREGGGESKKKKKKKKEAARQKKSRRAVKPKRPAPFPGLLTFRSGVSKRHQQGKGGRGNSRDVPNNDAGAVPCLGVVQGRRCAILPAFARSLAHVPNVECRQYRCCA
jgi:hypothetical protein